MNRIYSNIAAVILGLLVVGASYAATPELRMYRLDCGRMTLGDKSMMSDEGLYKGQSYDIVISCYLIKHGKNWLLWDTGLPKKYMPGPVLEGSLKTQLDRTVVDQLHDLGLQANDINYVVVSHSHFDHAGQVNDFPQATLIIQRAELAALADPAVAAEHFIDGNLLSAHISGKKLQRVRVIDGDVDLFGDGTLRTIQTPGHTPGSMALLLNLEKSGPYILSGDQWHFTENRAQNQVPTFNYDHNQTKTSGAKLERVIAQSHATLVIQHEPLDNQKLPKPPAFLD